MSAKVETQYGEIEITDEVIAKVVGLATTQNYGVVGMASRSRIRDGIQDILQMDNYSRGVKVTKSGDEIVVDVYIIVSYGTKISEVCRNVQNSVKYDLHKYLGIDANVVNIFVQDVYSADSDEE